ncbi:hypothetical protein FRC09_006738 [Ceratobasidium sp. 395]|nr:hypothetical protein FRC09_006738 [Ceratobasidium sp. 395]
MTTLLFSKDCIANTTLSYQDGTVAYIIKSDFAWKNRSTVITDANGKELAQINWKKVHRDTVTINGETMEIAEMMPKHKSLMSMNRYFKTDSGEEFEWKVNRRLYCVPVGSDICVATFYRETFGILEDKHPAYIDITDRVIAEQDRIVVLSKDCATNSTLSYQDGTVAYTIQSDFAWRNRSTVIADANGKELARINWKMVYEDTVTTNGKTMKLSEMMPRDKSLMGRNRFFKNESGEQFEWRVDRRLYCVPVGSEICVATFYESSTGILEDKSPAYIDITDQGIAEQDLIVVTCIIMENVSQSRESVVYGGRW